MLCKLNVDVTEQSGALSKTADMVELLLRQTAGLQFG